MAEQVLLKPFKISLVSIEEQIPEIRGGKFLAEHGGKGGIKNARACLTFKPVWDNGQGSVK